MDDSASQSESPPVDNPNLAAAAEQNGPGAEIVECPSCHNPRRRFLIVDGKCDSCRTKDQPATITPTLGWPEVRARRDRIIANTDWTQLADISPEVRDRYAPIREQLRDVTTKPDPFAAWYVLDELEVQTIR